MVGIFNGKLRLVFFMASLSFMQRGLAFNGGNKKEEIRLIVDLTLPPPSLKKKVLTKIKCLDKNKDNQRPVEV